LHSAALLFPSISEENKSGDFALDADQLPQYAVRDDRAAVTGGKVQDRASLLLKNYIEATFKVHTAHLTQEEISQAELAERDGLLQGQTLISQWPSAQ
jgi:hypothetical protein